MAPKKGNPKHFWNTIQQTLTMSAIDTLTELQFNTGISPDAKKVMLIKRIALSHDFDLPAAPTTGAPSALFAVLSTTQDLTTIPGLQAVGTIYFHGRVVAPGGDGATAAESPAFADVANGFPSYVEFDDPIPVADATLSFYLDSIVLATVVTAAIKIWYAVDDVSLEEALVILESYR